MLAGIAWLELALDFFRQGFENFSHAVVDVALK
jgi:hypothetical protein